MSKSPDETGLRTEGPADSHEHLRFKRLRVHGQPDRSTEIDLVARRLDADPSDPKGWSHLISLHQLAGDVEGEAEALERRIEAIGGDLRSHRRLVELYERLGRADEAMRHQLILEDASAKRVAMPLRPPKARGDLDAFERQVELAEARLQSSEQSPAAIRWRLYQLCSKLNDLGRATTHLRAWVEAPDGGGAADAATLCDVLSRLEWLSRRTGDQDAEINALERLQGAGGKTSARHARLFRLFVRKGRASKSELQLTAIAKVAANDPAAAGRLARLRDEAEITALSARSDPERTFNPMVVPLRSADVGAGRLAEHTLVFPHAYKTGGTSLRAGLRSLLRPHCAMLGAASYAAWLEHLPADRRMALDVICGHFGYDEAEDELAPLLGKSPVYVGVVRDPVDRARSIYGYWTGGYAGEVDRRRKLRVRWDADVNVVIRRWISARDDWSGWRADQCRTICGEASADTAIEIIRARYLAVVTPAGINRLLKALAEALGCPWSEDLHRNASGSDRLTVEPDLEQSLRRYQAEDQRLFEWVAANEERMIARAAAALSPASA